MTARLSYDAGCTAVEAAESDDTTEQGGCIGRRTRHAETGQTEKGRGVERALKRMARQQGGARTRDGAGRPWAPEGLGCVAGPALSREPTRMAG